MYEHTLGKLRDLGSFEKQTLMCLPGQILGEKGVLLRLDTWNAEFMDQKDIWQKPEDKEDIRKTQCTHWKVGKIY